MDDVMAELIKQNGNVNGTVEYLGKINGSWVAVPATVGSQIKGPCSRIDLMVQLSPYRLVTSRRGSPGLPFGWEIHDAAGTEVCRSPVTFRSRHAQLR